MDRVLIIVPIYNTEETLKSGL